MNDNPSNQIQVKADGESQPAVSAIRPSDWMFLQPSILDGLHDSVIITDLDGIVTGCNRATSQIYGYKPEELIGKRVTLLYHPDDSTFLTDILVPALKSTGEFRGEIRNCTRSGETIYVHLSVSALHDSDGKPVGMVGFSVDVTAQKLGDLAVKRSDEVERLLHASRSQSAMMNLLVQAVERAQDVFLITEAEPIVAPGPRILYVNQAFEQMTGYSREEILGRNPRILRGPLTDRAALDRIHACLKQWKPVREELVNYRKDGTCFTVELSIFPIADERGWFTHWVAVQRDITEQRQLREELEQGKSRLHFLTEAIPQLLWTSTNEGNCQFVSDSCARFIGAAPSEILGDGWYRFIYPEDLERTAKVWKAALADGKTFSTEYRLRRHDGQYIWFLHQAVPRVGPNGEILEWIGSSTNIEREKRAEEAIRKTEKLAAVGRMASSIAHEINNPLASVTNLLYLLSADPSLDQTARGYVKTAQEELRRVSEVTSQTLRFHKQASAAAPTRISELLDSILSFYRPRLVSAGIQVRREYQRTGQLICYATEIRHALANLVGNAIEASRNGGRLRIRLRESVSWKFRRRRGIRVTIADTGHGIDKALMPRIFEAFYTTKGDTGTGLGLWITNDLIAKHEGMINIRSCTKAGTNGTTISIFLPFERKLTPSE